MSKIRELTIPRAEVDTFAASAAINEAVYLEMMSPMTSAWVEGNASQMASSLLAGFPVLTVDDSGEYVRVKVAEEPASGDK